MDTNIDIRCSKGEDEIFTSNSNEASKPPETISSLNEAKQDKTTAAHAKTIISVQPFKSRDEFLSAMIEDVTEWLNSLFGLDIKSSELMLHLQTGVLLCRLANILDSLMVGDEKRDASDPADGGASKSKDEGEVTSEIRRSVATRPLAAIGGNGGLVYREKAPRGSFQSRDNISNFLNWCRTRLKLADTVLFETEDLVAGRNERNVILCLLEVARRGSKHGMPVPELIELETEIDAEIGQESMAEDDGEVERLSQEEEDEDDDDDDEEEKVTEDQSNGTEIEQATSASDLGALCEVDGSMEKEDEKAIMAALMGGRQELDLTTMASDATPPSPRAGLCLRLRDLLRMRDRRPEIHRMRESIQVDMLTLDEVVRRFLGNCRCQHQYPMIKVSEGKYRVGDNLMLIFVRLLRNHVMLRIGGGWETLADYLRRHDPCRATEHCRMRERHTCSHAVEETMAANDETTPSNVKSSPSEEENTPEKGKNAQKTEGNKPAEDKDMPEKEKITQKNDEIHETTEATKQQELKLNEANENISA